MCGHAWRQVPHGWCITGLHHIYHLYANWHQGPNKCDSCQSCSCIKKIQKKIRAFDSTPSIWSSQRPSLKNKACAPQVVLWDKEKRKGIERKKESEKGLADRCGEGRSRQTPSFLSSGGIAGILTGIVSCQVSSLLVGWVSQSWGWSSILWGLSFITASHGCVMRCTRSLCHSLFVHSKGR